MSQDEVGLLEAECLNARDVSARHDLIREGDPSGLLFVILVGLACRYPLLPEGTRQIIALLMPGNCCDMHLLLTYVMEHSTEPRR